MARFLRVSAAVLAMLVAVNAAEAQGGGGGGGGGGQRGGAGGQRGGGRGGPAQITMLLENIELSEAVKAKVDTLSAAFTAEQQKMVQEMGGAGGGGAGRGGMSEEMRTKSTEMTNEFRAKVRALLTEPQQAQFDENLKNLPQGRGRGGE